MAFDFSRSRIGLMPPAIADQGDIGDITAGINPAMRAAINARLAVNRQALMEAIRNPDVQADPEAHARALSYFSAGAEPDASILLSPGVLRAQAHRQAIQRGQEEAMGTANEAARVQASAVARALRGESLEPQALGLLSPQALAGTQAERMLPTRQALMGAQTETEQARPELLRAESEFYRGRGHFFDLGGNAPGIAARAEAGRTERSEREDRRRSDAGLQQARMILQRAGAAYRDPLKTPTAEAREAVLDEAQRAVASIEAQLGPLAQRPEFQAALDQLWNEAAAEPAAVPTKPSATARALQAPAPSPRNAPAQQADDRLREQIEGSQRFRDLPEGEPITSNGRTLGIKRGGRIAPVR